MGGVYSSLASSKFSQTNHTLPILLADSGNTEEYHGSVDEIQESRGKIYHRDTRLRGRSLAPDARKLPARLSVEQCGAPRKRFASGC